MISKNTKDQKNFKSSNLSKFPQGALHKKCAWIVRTELFISDPKASVTCVFLPRGKDISVIRRPYHGVAFTSGPIILHRRCYMADRGKDGKNSQILSAG